MLSKYSWYIVNCCYPFQFPLLDPSYCWVKAAKWNMCTKCWPFCLRVGSTLWYNSCSITLHTIRLKFQMRLHPWSATFPASFIVFLLSTPPINCTLKFYFRLCSWGNGPKTLHKLKIIKKIIHHRVHELGGLVLGHLKDQLRQVGGVGLKHKPRDKWFPCNVKAGTNIQDFSAWRIRMYLNKKRKIRQALCSPISGNQKDFYRDPWIRFSWEKVS